MESIEGLQRVLAPALRRKVYWRILPILFLAYVVSFLDRTNIGYAGLTMNHDLGFSAEVFGFGAGLFSIGYLIFEIPGALWSERWSAKKWLIRIMITWGIIAALFGVIQNEWQFYVLRFLLGLAEGGFVPGVLVFLSHWFPQSDRARAISWFYIGLPISQVIGGPLASLLLGVNWFHVAGWRWLFVIEGLLAVGVGLLVALLLKDEPQHVTWLEEEEKEALSRALEGDKQVAALAGAGGRGRWSRVFADSRVIRVALSMFFLGIGFYGFNYFVPLITKQLSNLPNVKIGLLLAIPFLLGAIAMYLNGRHSDMTQERRWHTAVPWLIGAIGLLLIGYGSHRPFFLVIWVSIAAIGLNAYFGSFWAIPQVYFQGLAAAGAVGLINMVGNFGGFVGPYLTGFLTHRTGQFHSAIVMWAAAVLIAVVLILSLAPPKTDPRTDR